MFGMKHPMSKPVDPACETRMPSEGFEHDVLWVREAMDRLAAYRRGEMGSIPLSEVIAKYIPH